VAGVSELGVESVGVGPVDGGLVCTDKGVGAVGSEGDGGDSAHDLGLLLDEHVLASHLGDGTVSGSNHDIVVGEKLDGVDSEGEQTFGRAAPLEQHGGQGNLNDVTGSSSQQSVRVIGSDGDALVDSLYLAHVDVLVEDLLLLEIDSPDADTVVVNGDELLVGIVEESDLVSHVHADTVSDNSFAGLDIPNDQLVIVLAAERSQILLVLGKMQILDEHFVKLEAVQHRHGVEVPNDNVSLESHVGLLA